MKTFKFEIGNQVKVTKKDGSTFNGKIKSSEINACTYKKEYDVLYFDKALNREMRMMGVPETAITLA